MNTTDSLKKEILQHLTRKKSLIILVAILFAALLFLYVFFSKPIYTSRASVFPLNNQSESSLSGSIGSLLGMGNASNAFSNDAPINIIELANSRNVRESVVATRLPEFSNKTIAELLIQSVNDDAHFYNKKIKIPQDSISLVTIGAQIFGAGLEAKVNKNGVLELYYSNTNQSIVKPISYVIISKISQFYIDLRTQKAQTDYLFIAKKIDSLNAVVKNFDRAAIQMDRTTQFTPDILQYTLPKANLSTDKMRLMRQRDGALSSSDEALWRLQKATPIIATLDKPEPPFEIKKKSPIIFSIIGFFIGAIFGVLLAIRKPLTRYVNVEIKKAIMD